MRIKTCTAAFSVVCLLLLFLMTSSAKADSLSWSWAISGVGFYGNGTMTSFALNQSPPNIVGVNPGPTANFYVVSSISGTLNGLSLTLSPGFSIISDFTPGGLYWNTNVLYGPSNGGGINFIDASGQSWRAYLPDLNPLPVNPDFLLINTATGQGGPVFFQIAPASEPSVLPLLGIGLIGFVGLSAVKKGSWPIPKSGQGRNELRRILASNPGSTKHPGP